MSMFLMLSLSLGAPSFAGAPATTAEVPEAAAALPQGLHISLEQAVDAPASEVWGLLAHDYVSINDWSSVVLASREMLESDLPEGFAADADAPVIGRIVTSGFGDVSETLVMYDEDEKTFTFRAGGLPGFIAYSQNTHAVLDMGDGTSLITYDIYLVPKGPMRLMKGKLERRFQEVLGHHLEEAKDYIETGELSQEKQAQLSAI